ncbi:MAG: hypothetical protein RSA66_08705 [Muribaculaceae bacterium]
MKKSAQNIIALLRESVPVTLRSDNFRFSELSDFARISATAETTINLIVGDNLTFQEVQSLSNISNRHIHVDLSKN